METIATPCEFLTMADGPKLPAGASNARAPQNSKVSLILARKSESYHGIITRPLQSHIQLHMLSEGQITDFFSYIFLEITKKSHTKITKSQKNHMQSTPKITNH